MGWRARVGKVRCGFGVGWGKKRCWRGDGEAWNGIGKGLEKKKGTGSLGIDNSFGSI